MWYKITTRRPPRPKALIWDTARNASPLLYLQYQIVQFLGNNTHHAVYV